MISNFKTVSFSGTSSLQLRFINRLVSCLGFCELSKSSYSWSD